jgi:hypothetical protein
MPNKNEFRSKKKQNCEIEKKYRKRLRQYQRKGKRGKIVWVENGGIKSKGMS